MKTLPDYPPDLIRIAIRDLERAEADPRYRINMNMWHGRQMFGPKCAVCLAGAVVAFSLETPPEVTIFTPNDLDADTASKLYALNAFRRGFVLLGCQYASSAFRQALNELRLSATTFADTISTYEHDRCNAVTPYEQNRERFKADMLRISGWLAANWSRYVD